MADGYVASPVDGNAIALMPASRCCGRPGPMPIFVHQAAVSWAGRRAASAPRCLARRAAMRLHGIAVLPCCWAKPTATAARLDLGGWLAAHVLTIAWSLAGLGILALGRRTAHPDADRKGVTGWVVALSLLVVGLALRGAWHDPTRPYASCVAVLTAAALVGALAVWQRRAPLAYVSGLLPLAAGYTVWQAWLVDVIGVQTWLAWGPGVLDRFLFIEALCLAGSSLVWSMTQSRLRRTRGFAGEWRRVPASPRWWHCSIRSCSSAAGLLGDLWAKRSTSPARWHGPRWQPRRSRLARIPRAGAAGAAWRCRHCTCWACSPWVAAARAELPRRR